MFRLSVDLSDLASTNTLGQRIADTLGPRTAVALAGELGSGKTTLARSILRALGVRERIPSPTFTLVQSYRAVRFTVSHFDLYRVENGRELAELAIEEALAEGPVLIEWPELARTVLPRASLDVALTLSESGCRAARLHGPVVPFASIDRRAHVG